MLLQVRLLPMGLRSSPHRAGRLDPTGAAQGGISAVLEEDLTGEQAKCVGLTAQGQGPQ
jgi:hypothetical protein